MQNDPLSHGLWEATAPPAPPTGPLSGEIKADVAVVGCGYTGLSAALSLAEAGAKVVALEAVEVGFGAAGRNVGYVNAGMWVMPSVMQEALGPLYGERALKLLGDSPRVVWETIEKHGLDCDPVRKGTIQPLAYARGLARAAIAAGADIRTQSPVRRAERTGKTWTLQAGGGTVTADWIAVATEAYGGEPWPEGRREQILLPYFNFATAPLSPDLRAAILPGREGCWDTRKIMSYFRLDRDGRLVFGSPGALRGTGLAVHRAWAKRALRKIFPRLGEPRFEHQWYGMIGMTSDSVPRFHRLAENVVTFCGYNGRGIGTGTVFGRVLADHILGRIAEKDLPLPVTAPEKPALPSLREAYYEIGAQIAHFSAARL